jgi:SAM-dependent methyltransferase
MNEQLATVAAHYGDSSIGDRILAALREEGIDIEALTPEILAPIDHFHTRGIAGTRDQADMARPGKDMHVLDIGCGIGGPARYLASTYGCRVSGIDLTPAFIDVAKMLTERCKLGHLVDFQVGNALDLPFADESFDMVWTQNVTVNIADKTAFYREAARVLRPGGRFTSIDHAAGPEGPPYFPLPWADVPEISFLVLPGEMRVALEASGLNVLDFQDATAEIVATAGSTTEQARLNKLGIGLLVADGYEERYTNSRRSEAEGRCCKVQFLAEKSR